MMDYLKDFIGKQSSLEYRRYFDNLMILLPWNRVFLIIFRYLSFLILKVEIKESLNWQNCGQLNKNEN